MIRFVQGDLLSDPADVLVNPVNCVGVMGAGLAAAFKHRFPANFYAYRDVCQRHALKFGEALLVPMGDSDPERFIMNLPTKLHWKDPSRLEYIQQSLMVLATYIEECGFKSVALPALGCGCGGLDWPEVRSMIIHQLSPFDDVEINVYGEPDEQ